MRLTSFWAQLGGHEGAKNAKKRLQEGSKKGLEKKEAQIIGSQLEGY